MLYFEGVVMSNIKKILLRSAGLGMIFRSLLAPHIVLAHVEDGVETVSPHRGAHSKQLDKIHFHDRVELVKTLNQKSQDMEEEKRKVALFERQLATERKELAKAAKGAGFTEDSVEVLKDKNCFMNTITKEDAKAYGNLSALVYDIDQNKRLAKVGSAVTRLDREITTAQDEMVMLEKKLSQIPLAESDFRKFVKDLRVFGIELDKEATISSVHKAINDRWAGLNESVRSLQIEKRLSDSQYLENARQVFDHNLQGMTYKVEGVFHRNNGEFSGAAAFDKDKNKLVLTFAGSKSTTDWIKNLMGWNSKLSKSHGLLSNISFHSGFGSHLDDNADSFFSFMRGWLTQYKEQNPNKVLNLVGTGHSLGGALGEIFSAAAKEMAEVMGIKINLGIMTFGAPNTVNANTLENYTKLIGGAGNVVRFAHSYDPVPAIVFWKSAPGATTLKGDTSLFKDVNGTMVLPIRVNPHSSDEYYHAAEKVFEDWEKSLIPLKARLDSVTKLEDDRNTAQKAIGKIANEAHGLLTDLANQDKNSAAVFEDEYQGYIAKERQELVMIQDSLQSMAKDLKERKEKHDLFTLQEQEEFVKNFDQVRQRLSEKKSFIEGLEKDLAWKTYAQTITDDFANLLDRITQDSLSLSVLTIR